MILEKPIFLRAALGVVLIAAYCPQLVLAPAYGEEVSMETLLLCGFGNDQPRCEWSVQNDTVMGGRSAGGFQLREDELFFSGLTNTNGGGFSSIRLSLPSIDLSEYAGIRLNVRADGRKYTWSIQTDALWRGRKVSYWTDFTPEGNESSLIDIPFTAFLPQFRGFKLSGPPMNTRNITEFALYQYDKTDGPFSLTLTSVEAYKNER
jgi:NADH dehydrogenase [ubiquinone] 1 alpha subcomplex assembly factor 1